MGTPDLMGSYGTFSYYTEKLPENSDEISGGEVHLVHMVDNRGDLELEGPEHPFRIDKKKLKIPFTVYLDPSENIAKFVIGDTEFILKEKEWREWVSVYFSPAPLIPGTTGICRFYLKQVRPYFKLYVTPLNIDPSDPSLPISTPENFSAEIYRSIGYYYTQGMAEDTKALSGGILTDDEYIQQAKIVLNERIKLFDYCMKQFKRGLLFFYFSSLDQNTHMFWRLIDRNSPIYDKALAEKYGSFLDELYIKMDDLLGSVLEKIDSKTTLIIMSDHGFAPFNRSFNLNSWLEKNGYITLIDEVNPDRYKFFENVDWSMTRAYGLGINSLYINQKGREKTGIVSGGEETEQLVDEIARKLEEVTDPLTGDKVVRHAYVTRKVYSGKYAADAPEIIVGYDRGYRGSWETALGEFTKEIFGDNLDKWSGDHCMDAEVTPGVLLMNRKTRTPDPALYDLTVTILKEFGIKKLKEMVGEPIE